MVVGVGDVDGGRQLVLAGQKSGIVYALDPDKDGQIVWEARVGKGGVNGGVQWGMASDGKNLYAATSDVVRRGAAGYDPNGYLNFLTRVAVEQQQQGGAHGGAFSTHPDAASRVAKVRQQIAAMGSRGGATLRDRFEKNVGAPH